jgi:hypothetical protein
MTKPVINSFTTIAPLLIQQYERYLPTAFDESLSLLQKVNKIIKTLDSIGQLSNDVVAQWNTVYEWLLNEGLADEVGNKIDEMYENGQLATIIGNVLDDLGNQINDIAKSVKDIDFGAKGDGVTSDQTALVNAFSYAYTNGIKLFLPKGTYLTTDTIPYFHDVYTFGDGVIKRGSDLFNITPKNVDTNIIYVGYGGQTSFDGLTSSQPTTFAKATSILQMLGSKASLGQWRLQFVNGLCTENGVVFNNMPYFAKPLQIWGKWDGVTHLAIWDGSVQTEKYAIRSDGNNNSLNIEVKDLKFQNWTNDPSNAGALVFWYDVNVRTENVYCYNCTVGIWCRGGYSRHYADRLENCNWGYSFQYSHSAMIGSSLYTRNKITNCNVGVFNARTSIAHVDYTDFDQCTVNMQAHQKSRMASVNSTFKGWEDVSHWLQGDSLFENDGSTWDANSITDATPIYRLDTGSSIPAVHIGPVPYRVAHYVPNTGFTVSGGQTDVLISSQTGFGSPLRIPKHLLFNNASVQIVVKMRVDVSGTTGGKTVKLAGANSTSQVISQLDIPASVNGGGLGEVTFELTFRGNGTALAKAKYESNNKDLNLVSFSTVPGSVIDSIRDKTTDLTLWRIYGTVASVDDTMNFYSISANLIG